MVRWKLIKGYIFHCTRVGEGERFFGGWAFGYLLVVSMQTLLGNLF